ncbi:MAG: M48 family metallopeptidase [Candidatus Magasanikbacteria bacterium]|nr:M48 family metallopeptidase [Candidatus Magasanikbacteria bacterium]
MYNQIDANKRKTWLLIGIFSAIIIVIGYVLNEFYGFGYESVIFAMIISIVMSLTSYYHGDKLALWSTGARPISKEENPYVYRLVENLCISAGMPVPKIHLIDSPALNAFATGRDPAHASIALTTGIVEALENEELEGVIAHELSHVKNYDIRVMTVVIVLVGVISLLADWFLRARWLGMGRRRDNERGGGQVAGLLALVGFVFLIISPLVAELIKLAVSRKREFLADASGALLTRYPEGLARALEKISASSAPLQTASTATAHLFIANPLKSSAAASLFSTHPPAAERIKRLRAM